jgi:hypothetical protein
MGAESTLICRQYFSSIFEDQLIISVLNGCHVIIFESHGILGEDFLVFIVLQ